MLVSNSSGARVKNKQSWSKKEVALIGRITLSQTTESISGRPDKQHGYTASQQDAHKLRRGGAKRRATKIRLKAVAGAFSEVLRTSITADRK